jgi:hypothetical protein
MASQVSETDWRTKALIFKCFKKFRGGLAMAEVALYDFMTMTSNQTFLSMTEHLNSPGFVYT